MGYEIQYDNVVMPQYNFPIKVFRRETNRESLGCEFHWHEQLEFYFCLSGGIHLICNGAKDWIHAGDIAFVKWCQPHKSIDFLDDTAHYIIQIDISMLSSGGHDICEEKYVSSLVNGTDNIPTFIKGDTTLNELFKIVVNEYENKSYGYELSVKAAILNIFSHLFRIPGNNATSHSRQSDFITLSYVKKMLIFISQNYGNEISLHAMGLDFGISVPYMCRIFKKHTGTTIVSYINQLRCHRATSLIAAGTSITEAAFMVGYHDYNYFSRVFKRIMGFPPSVVQKNSSRI